MLSNIDTSYHLGWQTRDAQNETASGNRDLLKRPKCQLNLTRTLLIESTHYDQLENALALIKSHGKRCIHDA